MRALILEDLPESQQMLCDMAVIAFPGIECVCVADVTSASRHVSEDFHLALIDLSLPDGSGLEVIDEMARTCPTCTLVVTTIFDDDEHLFPALRAGAHGYLLKDEDPEMLVQQLRGIRAGRPPLSASVARRLLLHFRQPRTTEQGGPLSPREREVLIHLAQGFSIADIAYTLGITHHTVGDHVKNIYRKLKISSRAEAALEAQKRGLV